MDNIFKLSTMIALTYLLFDNKRSKLTVKDVEDHIAAVARNPTTRLGAVLRMSAEQASRPAPFQK